MKNILLLLCTGLLFFSCSDTPRQSDEIETKAVPVSSDTSHATSCPYLTTDNHGNIVLSWVKEVNDSANVMCYAISADKGKTFNEATEIPSSRNVHPHGENMPKIVFKPGGEIIAVWGTSNPSPKNKYSGLVFYSQSFDNGKTWCDAKRITYDTASIDERYFDIALLPNGEAGIIWLDNRKQNSAKEGSILYYASTHGRMGFENEMLIGETCCPCCRTDLFVDSRNNIHVAYRDIINDSIRDMVHSVSLDEGKTFSFPKRISADNWAINGCPHTGPTITENKKGLHFAWYTAGGGAGVFYCNSSDNGNTFSLRDSVSGKSSSKHPQITTLKNGDIIIVWDETVKKGENYNAWIGLQHRNPDGKTANRIHITSADAVSEFPVIKTVDSTSVIVAYTQRTGKKKQEVYYQVINF